MYKLLPILLLVANTVFAQELPSTDYTVIQAQFLKADAAKVYPLEEGVSIRVEGLKPGANNVAILLLENKDIKYVEVSKLLLFNGQTVALFPPSILTPVDPGEFHISGKAGDRFGVAYRTLELAQWIEIFIGSSPPPDPIDPDPIDPIPVPGEGPSEQDLADISVIVRATTTLNDPITADTIREGLTSLSLSEVKDVAQKQIQQSIKDSLIIAMEKVNPPYKNWNGVFRIPLNTKLLSIESKLKTTKDLQRVVDVVVKALSPTQLISNSKNNTITIYTRPDCTVCEQWKRNIYPLLEKVGWKLIEVHSDSTVPKFVVCAYNKCSKLHTGYLGVPAFNTIVESLK